MQAIWKFPLEVIGKQEIDIPKGAKILTVQTQFNTPCIWAICDINVPKEKKTINMIRTGHGHDYIHGEYIGTTQVAEGRLVWHFFIL